MPTAWKPTNGAEMKAFMGIILAVGIHKLPYLHVYWNQHPLLGAPGITQCMPCDWFKKIIVLRYLHLNDNSQARPRNDPNYDKLHKVRPLLNNVIISDNIQQAYIPHQQLSVDEAMVCLTGGPASSSTCLSSPSNEAIRFGVCALPSMG
jgi:hypothetical protein